MSSHYRYWGQSLLRGGLGAILLCCAAVAGAQSSGQQADSAELLGQSFDFDVPAQQVSTAILEIARQAQIQALMAGNVLDAYQTEALDERLSLAEALDRVLSGTPYAYQQTGRNAIMVGTPEALQEQSAIAGQNTIGQRRPGIEEIIVTGQKREERLQDVPIAISAFTAKDLEAQKIEGGFDLLKAVPNVTFTKTNFTGYNFQIRGIGTQAISATTDPAVAVSMNNTTLIVNRLFEQEYLDVERVEVLRGPQGTLYGRNATAGVINVITNKPELGVWSGMLDVEVGNYNTRRLRGHFNMPLGDEWAIRGAYASTERDGYATNEFDGNAIDGRDLWTGRLSVGWQPTDRFRADFLWERFEEDDDRLRSAKNLCHRDPGPDQLAGIDIDDAATHPRAVQRVVQQGCLPGSLYSDDAFSVPNGDAHPFIIAGRTNNDLNYIVSSGCISTACSLFGNPLALLSDVDVYTDVRQSRDLRTVFSPIEPEYRAQSDLYEFSFEYQWTDALQLTSRTVYAEDEVFSTQDFTRYEASPGLFSDIGGPDGLPVWPQFADFAPNGIFCDPQLGCSTAFLAQDISQSESEQFNQQFELGSDFAGPWNFQLGVNYTRFETTADYFFFSNVLTALAQTPPFDGPIHNCTEKGTGCVSIQQGSLNEVAADPQGHNFFLSRNPYELESVGVFGESYWQATPTVKLTLGLRMTWDQKVFSPTPSQTLLPDYRETEFGTEIPAVDDPDFGPESCTAANCIAAGNAPGGIGYPAAPDIVQTWREPTGRLVVDWTPILPFTDETLVYASYAHGYKGGGANPPSIAPPAVNFIKAAQGAVVSPTFEPEFVNAYEIGAKNTLFGGVATLNLTGFYYDYTDYQVSKIVDRSAANENFDAEVWGLELEALFAPTLNWQFNAAIGYLQTKIAEDERSIDLMDRTQGGDQFFITQVENPDWNPGAEQLARADYVATDECVFVSLTVTDCSAPAGQQFLAFDDWVVVKPNAAQSSNCIAPAPLVQARVSNVNNAINTIGRLLAFCPAGTLQGNRDTGIGYNPGTDAPNGSAGFFADVGGNELPNAPHFTVSLGGQYSFDLTRDWRATARLDYYWQDESYARVYNTEYDRLKSWSNTNLSFWVNNPVNGITVEAYVKNVFDETPITGTFLNSDDTALTTNVFTLDPRLIGVSVRKEF